MIRILFMHNTIAAYRIPWFLELAKNCDIKFVVTNEKLNEKIYKNKIDYDKVKGLDIHILKRDIRGLLEVASLLDRKEYDFVELPPVDTLYEYIVSKLTLHICKAKGIRTCYFWEKWEAPIEYQPFLRKIKNRILRLFASNIFNNVDCIFAGGSKSKEYFLSAGANIKKIHILPNVSETSPCERINLRQIYHISGEKKIILYLGRIIPEKGLDILIQGVAKLDNIDAYHLLIVGDGKFRRYCEKLAYKLELSNITFAGSVHPDKRETYFEQSDIFVFPVTYRNGCVDVWGLTVNEALQHGKIVIATKAVGSAFDLIKEGVNGLVVEPEDVESLKQAIEKTEDERMIVSAKEYDAKICNIYSYANMSLRYVSVLENLMSATYKR